MGSEHITFERIETGPLRRFEVSGFRNFGKDAGINLKQLNIVVGPNGAGKSTLLGLFQLFDKTIRSGDLHHIGIEDLDEFGLISPNQKPFTIRLHFDDFVFAYEYRVAKHKDWKLNRAACFLPSHLKKPLIQFGPQKAVSIHTTALTEWLVKCSNLGTYSPPLQGEKRMNLNIAAKVLECLSHFNIGSASSPKSFKSGAIVNFEGGWYEFASRRTKYSRYAFSDFGRYANNSLMFVSAINSLKNNGWEDTDMFGQYFHLDTQACSIPDRELYEPFKPWFESVRVQAEEWSSNGLRKGPWQNLIITWAVASVERRLTTKEQDALQIYFEEALNTYQRDVPFFKDFDSVAGVLQGLVLVLLKGGSYREFGLLPPRDFQWYEKHKEQDSSLGRHSEFISTAEMDDLKTALVENKALRKETLKYLAEHPKLKLKLPPFNLACTLSLNAKGSIDYAVKKNRKPIDLESLSRGENKLLLIALFKEFYAFLEEPETNLHPNFQAQLGNLISENYVSKVVASPKGDVIWDVDRGVGRRFTLAEFNGEQNLKTPNAIWGAKTGRRFLFIETHSDVLLKAIQLQMVRELPKKELWNDIPNLTPSYESFEQEFSNLDPSIEVTYFGIENGKWVPKSMGLRRDGVFRETFGPGFYDQSLELVRSIFDAQSLN